MKYLVTLEAIIGLAISFGIYKKYFVYKRRALNVKMFNPDKTKATSIDEKIYGDNNFTSINFKYYGEKMPAIRIDGKFKLFTFKNKKKDAYSLAISCYNYNEPIFKKVCKVISRETCRLANQSMCSQEDFELVRNNKSGKSVYCKLYTKSLERLSAGYCQVLIRMK